MYGIYTKYYQNQTIIDIYRKIAITDKNTNQYKIFFVYENFIHRSIRYHY